MTRYFRPIKHLHDLCLYTNIQRTSNTSTTGTQFCTVEGGPSTMYFKHGTTRVYLNKILSDAFTQHRVQNPTHRYIFQSKSRQGHLKTRRLHDPFNELCTKAGVERPRAHPHTCRHTVAHVSLRCNNSFAHSSKFLGHKTINCTAVCLSSSNPLIKCSVA